MIKINSHVRIKPFPSDKEIQEMDPNYGIDWSSYDNLVAIVSHIEDGYASLVVPEKMILYHKPLESGAPLCQLAEITEKEFKAQIEEAEVAGKKFWDAEYAKFKNKE